MSEINYEDLDKQAADIVAAHEGQSASGNLAAFNLCATYKSARAIVVAVQSILGFFKPSWAAVIGILIGTLDASCSAPTPVA